LRQEKSGNPVPGHQSNLKKYAFRGLKNRFFRQMTPPSARAFFLREKTETKRQIILREKKTRAGICPVVEGSLKLENCKIVKLVIKLFVKIITKL
jgi:hypothetical protein